MFKPYHQRFLKVKIKSLSEESKIIRLEEKKSRDELQNRLHYHRTQDVRNESRAAQIAYAYLRGKDLKVIEKPKKTFDCTRYQCYTRASKIVKKFGTEDASKGFQQWLERA